MRRALPLLPILFGAACAGVHQEAHTGFHFEATVGAVGSTSSSNAHVSGFADEMSGGGLGTSVAAGGAVVPNLVVAGQLWLASMPDPHLHAPGVSVTATDSTYGVVGVGPMVKYYFMPANLYVSATPSFTRITFTNADGDASGTDWGFGLRAAVGKEWYVSEHWGLGVAGVLHSASNRDGGSDPSLHDATWGTLGGGLLFSASFR